MLCDQQIATRNRLAELIQLVEMADRVRSAERYEAALLLTRPCCLAPESTCRSCWSTVSCPVTAQSKDSGEYRRSVGSRTMVDRSAGLIGYVHLIAG